MNANEHHITTKTKSKWVSVFLLSFLPWLTACANAPSSQPFLVQKAGNKVELEFRAVEHRAYFFNLRFMYKESDQEDRERVRKLMGGYMTNASGKVTEPGVPIVLKLRIAIVTELGESPILDKEISELRLTSWGGDSFGKEIAVVILKPGRYRIRVESLRDVPELVGTPVIFSIGRDTKSAPISQITATRELS